MSENRKFQLKSEQRHAIYDMDGSNVLVSASAGSGKTFVMIERIIRLIREGKMGVNELLAVTFTDKAAFEMREKLAEALIESINSGEKKFKAELLDLPMADICTIDAFCSRLAKRYFYELGIGRDFEILSDIDKKKLTEDALSEVFDKFYSSGDERFLKTVSRFSKKRSDRDLRDKILSIYLYGSSEASLSKWLDLTDNVYTKTGLSFIEDGYKTAIEERLFKAIRGFKIFRDKWVELGVEKYQDYTDAVVEYLSSFIGANSLYEYANVKIKLPFSLPTVKNLDDEAKAVKDEFTKYRDSVIKKLNDAFLVVESEDKTREKVLATQEDFCVIKDLTLAFEEVYDRLKREENKFEFHDVERFALQLLNNDKVCDEIKSKYKYVFIDEYQDVNGTQDEIFTKIANNNEFMVGDVKQSIYGFRGCNSKLFEEKYDKMSKTGTSIWLNHNFRSSNAVINAVNKIFDNVMTKDDYGVDYKTSARLLPGGSYDGGGDGRASLHVLYSPKQEKQFDDAKTYDIVKEAQKTETEDGDYVALKVKEIILQELNDTYYDMKSKTMKKVELKDIAILCRQRSAGLSLLIKELAKDGIRVVSELEKNVLENKEIKLLVNYLEVLSCKQQEIPLAICMLSPIGNFTASEIAEIAGIANVSDRNAKRLLIGYDKLLNGEGELSSKVKSFDKYLQEQRVIADFKGAKTALENVIRDKNLMAYTLIKPLPDERERCLEVFLSESVSNGIPLSVDDFLYKVKNSPNSFCLSETAGGDALTIITSHKSKGLEYPVVIIIGLEKKFNVTELREKVLFDRDVGISLMTYDDKNRTVSTNILREYFRYRITTKQQRDEARLFYVATTRAKYSLHMISLEQQLKKVVLPIIDAERPIDFIPADFERTITDARTLAKNFAEKQTKEVVVGERDEISIAKVKSNLNFVYPHEEETTLILKTSVTANLSKEDKKDDRIKDFLTEDEKYVIKNAPSAEEGTLVHKIMENYDFKKATDFESEIDRLTLNGVVSKEELSSLDLSGVKKIACSPLFNDLTKFKLYKEQYFVCKVPAKEVIEDTLSNEKVLLQGVIDLLAIDGDSAYIIDYKYSSKGKEALIKTYAKQLRLYKYAVEISLNIKVEKMFLVNLLSGEIIETDV